MSAIINKPAVNPWLIAVVVSVATFMEVLDTTITNVSITHIAGNLAASQDESTWVLTSYLVANGIVLPISGWLSDRMGRKRFFITCILGFTGASFACGAAQNLEMLIFFRLIQGLAGGGLQPTQQAIILDAFPPHKRGQVFGLTGITLIAAPIIGPTLGGWITDNYSWRWIFFINIPVGLMAAFGVYRLVEDKVSALRQKTVDYIGLGLIAIGLGCLQIMLDKGQQDDWFSSNFIILMASIAGVSLLSAIYWLLTKEDPIVDLSLFKERSFAIGSILIFFVGFALYASSALLPLLVQSNFGYDATTAGLVLSAGGVAIIFLMPVAGKMVAKVQARYLIAFGLSCSALGMFYTSTISPETSYNTFALMRVTQVVGLPFLFIPCSVMAFSKIAPGKNNKASALFALARNLGGSIGIALASSFVARHAQMHQTYLAEHLSPGNPVYQYKLQQVTQTLTSQGLSLADAAGTAKGLIYRELIQQASILSYNDAYMAMTMVMLGGLVLTFFLPANRPGGKAPPASH